MPRFPLSLAAIALGALLSLAQPTYALESPSSSDTVILSRMMGYLQREKAEPVWPGYDLATNALVYGIGDRYYLLCAPTSLSPKLGGLSIENLPGVKRLETETVERFKLATDQTWDQKIVAGESVFIVKQMEKAKTAQTLDPIHEFLTLLHEDFHMTTQESFMLRMGEGDERLLDARDFAYTQLEASILGRLLDESRSTRLKAGAQVYLAIREKHEALLPKDYADYRQGMTVMEGTAQYLTDEFFKRSHPPSATNHIAMSPSRLKAELFETQEEERHRYYVTGSAVCHMLDRLMPQWKGRFTRYVGSLDALLAEAVDYKHQPEAVLRKLGPAYGVEGALSRYEKRYEAIARQKQQEIEAALHAYRQQGSSRLTVKLPPVGVARRKGTWVEQWDLPQGRELCRAKRFDVSLREPERVLLSVTNGMYILSNRDGQTFIEISRTLTPNDVLLNGKALDAETATGSLEIAQGDFSLKVLKATVTRQENSYQVDILEP